MGFDYSVLLFPYPLIELNVSITVLTTEGFTSKYSMHQFFSQCKHQSKIKLYQSLESNCSEFKAYCHVNLFILGSKPAQYFMYFKK